MRKRDHNVLTNAASLLVCGLLAGVVVAAAAFPAVALSGLAAKAGAETFDALPDLFVDAAGPQMSRLLAADGKTPLATMYDENRRDITKIDDIAPAMQQAILAAEDHDFYEHNGVDLNGVVRAFVNNSQEGSHQQGASTLTMQYVRLAIAYSATHPADVVAATEDTSARKIREMNLALQVEKQFTKDEILLRYLNIAAFGNGAYGIYAASQVYFAKPPSELTIAEAALLAGLVKAPSTLDPTTTSGYPSAMARRDYILDHMVRINAITEKEAEKAKASKPKIVGKRAPNGCVDTNTQEWGFFCDYFYRWWMEQEAFGSTSYDRERRLKSGGFEIITTMDPKVQKAADKAVRKNLPATSKAARMLAVVEPGTGRVRALSTNRNYQLDDPDNPENKPHSNPEKRRTGALGNYPNTVNPLLTGGDGITGYQAGSTFKMFTMVAALEKGIPLSHTINAEQRFRSEYIIDKGPVACDGHFYCPRNASPSMAGVHNMWSAFGRSVNTYFVPLQQQVGAEKVVEAAKKLGITFRTQEDLDQEKGAHQWGAFTLGVSQTTPLELANAYATLGADGLYCEPTPVQEIRDPAGNKLDLADPRCEQRISTEVARAAVDAARCPVGDRSSTTKCAGATARNVRSTVDAPVAGKSGTTDEDKTASLVAMTKQYSVAGIMADPDWPQTTQRMPHEDPRGINPPVYETLRDAMKGKPRLDFTPPEKKLRYGDQRTIPTVKCVSVEKAKSRITDAGFAVFVSPNRVESNCPAGTAAGTSPTGRTAKGSVVSIKVSSGPPSKPTAQPAPTDGQPTERPAD
ncbi:transglycosylase domain-containing protein [Salinispora mooreana]|uniref:transglycosylase domain-containing protein n=1 Tax=Salinispora mooreana TaxID=999545 RepID=UPI00039E0BDE|nr:transglycosylase domain-containing protein [Salinispora mooreana]